MTLFSKKGDVPLTMPMTRCFQRSDDCVWEDVSTIEQSAKGSETYIAVH